MKVVLVMSPIFPEFMPSLGLAYLSAYLKKQNHEVVVFDFNIEAERELLSQKILAFPLNPWIFINILFPELSEQRKIVSEELRNMAEKYADGCAEKILSSNPNIVGFFAHRKTALFSLIIAKKIKERSKKTLIVFGGPDATHERRGDFFIRTGFVDIVVIGEGEETLTEIVDKLKKKEKITYCSGTLININGKIINCEERSLIKNLDEIPFPDFDGFPLQKYEFSGLLPTTISRGCIGNCSFCAEKNFWKYFRQRSVENITQEIKQQVEKYNICRFFFCDSLINGNIELLNDLCDSLIKQKLKIYWGGNARISPEMTLGLLKKMYRAGCRFLRYGIESGSQAVLESMQKDVNIKYAKEILSNTRRANIWVYVYLIVGFPTETKNDFVQTLKFVYENRKNINTFNAHLFDLELGSPIFKKINESGMVRMQKKQQLFPEEIKECFKHFDPYRGKIYTEENIVTPYEGMKRKSIFDSIFKHKNRLEEFCLMFNEDYKITDNDSIQVAVKDIREFLN